MQIQVNPPEFVYIDDECIVELLNAAQRLHTLYHDWRKQSFHSLDMAPQAVQSALAALSTARQRCGYDREL